MFAKYNKRGFTIVELMFSTVAFSTVLLLCLAALVQIGRMYYKGVTTSQTQQTTRTVMDEIAQAVQFSSASIKSPVSLTTAPLDGSIIEGPVFTTPLIPVTNSSITQGSMGYFCIGSTRYTFAMDRKQDSGLGTPGYNLADKSIKHAIWVDEPSGCADVSTTSLFTTNPVDLTADEPTDVATYNGRDLLVDNMRLLRVDLVPYRSDNSVWEVRLTVAYGDDDLMDIDTSVTPARRFCKSAQAGTQFCATSELSTIIKRRVQ